MKSSPAPTSAHESLSGVGCAASAFLIWGLSPVYWKVLKAVPAFEIIMHRVIWSFFFLLPFLAFQDNWKEIKAAFKNRKVFLALLPTTMLLAFNWFIYIWAVNNDHLLQASLGYYINPLINVLLGMIFLRERLRPFQIAALVLAAIGVLYLTIQYGEFPWIALALAFAFGFYGLIRKVAPVSSLAGLSVEMTLLSVPALSYIAYLYVKKTGALFRVSLTIDVFLICTALVTAVPLLLFTLGARRIKLSSLGFLQYIAPSCMFLLAVFFYNEPIHSAQIWTFILIWTALGIYSTDSVIYYRQVTHLPAGRSSG